ncbi:hypothetical protein AS026_35655 [Rhizobium altiplani]|uniref:Uncharacterized protein n=1 Tax=Rhizobium altiplani TaxID=1864509 RepID=A0A109JVX2_9HYPH|nr:hypothetical protein [Rhizobium altiplani]KWV52023.1 hypothetical protein AS026_05510 [Rhizobium altiplani]KWV56020.1 hypothetical protein AS026_35715 [Rhizobium altiplani]KWV56065.1 hypothetical protein AS026_35680 [Rhizobium altiplani]KWV56068.1 hypothetical protein AS026_35655 [Rhizobium altiplani]
MNPRGLTAMATPNKPVSPGPSGLWRVFLVTSVLLALSSSAEAGNALENAIEKAQPCQSLKVKTGLFSIGVDKFEKVEIEEFAVDVKGDLATARAIGSLTCRTSDAAALKGNVSARLSFDAEMNLTTCVVSRRDIKLLSAGGTFGDVVKALGEQISQSLGDGLSNEAKKLCE